MGFTRSRLGGACVCDEACWDIEPLRDPHPHPSHTHTLHSSSHGSSAELLDLRQKFEQDKKRIAELRASRKWRPY